MSHFDRLVLFPSRDWAIPIVEHLRCQDDVQDESSHEPVENQLIIHFLHCGEDAGQGADEIIKYLKKRSPLDTIVANNLTKNKDPRKRDGYIPQTRSAGQFHLRARW